MESLYQNPETWNSMEVILATSTPSKVRTLTNQMVELVHTVREITHPKSMNSPPLSNISSSLLEDLDTVTTSSSTGILPCFKLASQKIGDLIRRSSPCKKGCSYHLQMSSKTHRQHITIPAKVPSYQRVTLPPLQDPEIVQTTPSCLPTPTDSPGNVPEAQINAQGSPKHIPQPQMLTLLTPKHAPQDTASSPSLSTKKSSRFFNCSPLLCTKRLDFAPISPDRPSKISRCGPSDKTFITNKWKAAFPKQLNKKKKKVKTSQVTTQTIWGMPLSPQGRISDSLSQSPGCIDINKKQRKMFPLRSSTPKSSSEWQPFFEKGYQSRPSSAVVDAMCSDIFQAVTTAPGSCRDPEVIRQRTRNASILTLAEEEEGDNMFSQGHWDIRDDGPTDLTDRDVNSGKPTTCDQVQTFLSQPIFGSSKHTQEVAPQMDHAKRKLFCSDNKHLPLKKRISQNFCEPSGSEPVSQPQFQPSSGTPVKKPAVSQRQRNKSIKKGFTGYTFVIEETTRTSRARKPLETVSSGEETISQLEELLTLFMSSRKPSTKLMMHPYKQSLLLEYARLCYITAVRIPGGVRLRKTSASRAPIPMDKEWMLS